jgi:hypothetical protein
LGDNRGRCNFRVPGLNSSIWRQTGEVAIRGLGSYKDFVFQIRGQDLITISLTTDENNIGVGFVNIWETYGGDATSASRVVKYLGGSRGGVQFGH